MTFEYRNNREAFEKGAGVASMIVEAGPHTTLRNCKRITQFIANAVSNQGQCGIEFDEDDRDAVFRILNTVASALEHVTQHISDRVEVSHG